MSPKAPQLAAGFFTSPSVVGKTITTEFSDPQVSMNTTVYYRLAAYDFSGNRSPYSKVLEVLVVPTSVEDETGQTIPTVFSLGQNYPNPFNPETRIIYALPRVSPVQLIIYDMLGRKVRHLVQTTVAAGYHTVVWDGRDDSGRLVSSSVYLYRLTAGDFVQTRRMILLR